MFQITDRRVAAAGAIALALLLTIGSIGLHSIGALVGASQWAAAHGVTSELRFMIRLLGAAGALVLVAAIVLFRRYARARRLTRDALQVSEARLRLIIANMVAGLITTSAFGRIESANPAAERIFGCTAGEMIGRSFGELIASSPGSRLDGAGILLARAIGRVTEWEGKRANGETFPLELSVVPYEADTGRQFEAYIIDISDRRDSDRLKDEFVSVVSHELRTPLTSIRAALQLVLEEKPAYQDPDHEPLLDIALKNCERLILSINDILDVSKSDAGLMHLKLSPCDLASVVGTALRIVEPSARSAGIALAVDLEPGLPAISGDFERLVQVLVNLLSNAVKFAPAGSIVAVNGVLRGRAIALSVRDRGPGIAEADLGQLFERFKQLAGPAPRGEGGTGLGLSIVKALVEGHGGQVTVDSRVGEGSTFTVTLPIRGGPIRPSSQAAIENVSADPPGRASLQATVLFAEDDADLRHVLSRSLRQRGFTVLSAPDGDVARGIFDRGACDLIVLDLQMPGLNGLEVIRHVRASERGSTVPIVVVSGSNSGGGERESIELGANLYMPKPIDVQRLVEELTGLLPARAQPLASARALMPQ